MSILTTNPMIKNGLLLGLFALCCTGLVALVHALTSDTISLQQQKQLTLILNQIIPPSYTIMYSVSNVFWLTRQNY